MAGPAFIVILSLIFFSCDDKLAGQPQIKGDTTMEESNGETGAVTLKSSVSSNNGKLSVEYSVKNSSGAAIYVFNRLWEFGPDGKYVPAPIPFYTLLDDKGGLHLLKGIPAVPKTKRVEMKIVPFATKLEPGQELSEKFELAEPIAEYNPYFPKERDNITEPRDTDSVLVSVHYIADIEGLEVKPAPLEGGLYIWHTALSENVHTLSSGPRMSVIKVMRRTDSFERF